MDRLGLTVFLLLAVAGATLVGGRGQRDRMLLLGGLAVAGLGVTFRDSPFVYAIDAMSILCTGALIIWQSSGKRLADLTVVQSIRAVPLALLSAAFGAPGAIRGGMPGSDDESAMGDRARRARALVIGAVLAVPPFLIVMALLGSSDKLFSDFIDRIGEFLANDLMMHVIVAGFFTWVAAGCLRGPAPDGLDGFVPEDREVGAPFLTVGVALYGLAALLALFMGLQLRTLFGGSEYLMQTVGLSVAEYARQGFFQLVVASGIVLATLVAAEWALAPDDADGRRRYRAIGTVLVALVIGLLISAATRMGLYVQAFGLTVDRLTATTVMIWVAIALVTFAFTTLRGRTRAFAPSLLAGTVVWVIALNAVNLEAVIVRVNIARAEGGSDFEQEIITDDERRSTLRSRGFDIYYHANLSADALPALLSAARSLPREKCIEFGKLLEARYSRTPFAPDRQTRDYDWRELDLPLINARAWHAEGALTPCAGGG